MGGGYVISIAIVDDDKGEATMLAERLASLSLDIPPDMTAVRARSHAANGGADTVDFVTSVFGDADSLEAALSDHAYDIVFMDIHLGGTQETGIDVVSRLFPPGSGVQVVYVTRYPQYHTQVYATEHLSFLTKPISDDDLRNVLVQAVNHLDRQRNRPIRVLSGTSMYAVEPREIRYIESTRRVLHIHAISVISTYATLSQFCRLLPRQFLQCHKSFVFNMDYFKVFTGDRIILLTGESIPVSQRRRAYTRDRLNAYLRGI